MKKYIVSIEKLGESRCFLKLLYKIEEGKLEKLQEIVYPNCNKLKIITRRAEYDVTGLYDSNIEILENVDVAILKIQDTEELKEDIDCYKEESEISTKYFTYLNKITLEYLDEKICEVMDFNDIISDFFKFKHEEIGLILDNKPLTSKIYFKFENNIYGPMKYEIRNGYYYFKPVDSRTNNVKKYKLKEVTNIIYDISTNNYIKNIIMPDEISVKISSDPNFQEEKEDFIEKELLVKQFVNLFKNDSEKLNKTEINLLKEKLKKDLPIFFESKDRKKILEDKIIEDEIYLQIKENIIEGILKDEEKLKNICKKIATENFSEIEKNSDISKIIDELKEKKISKEKELEELSYKIENEEKKLKEILNNKEKELEIHNSEKLDNLREQIIEAKNELKNLDNKKLELDEECKIRSEKLKGINTLEKLNEEKEYLKKRIKEEETEEEELKLKIENLRKEAEKYSQENIKGYSELLNKSIETIKKEYKNNYFEFFTFNKLQEIENEKYQENIKNKFIQNPIKKETMKISTINNFIEKQLLFFNEKANRKIDKNDLINIFICISQGFLTVFAGEPGVGKTSLCRILGKSMGLYDKDNSRYIEISVEKGWTSKRDFIGYYNPLSKQIDYANKRVFKALTLLDFEEKENINEYPFLFALDEANLSPMEYYWADFMNVCEMDSEEKIINIGDDYSYMLPKTLRFLATINYDHTTEVFSPRLLDRAWVILLENSNLDVDNFKNMKIDSSEEIIPYSIFEELNDIEEKEFPLVLENRLKEIIAYLKTKNIMVSPRVQKMIRNYCIKGNELFEKRKNDLISLDYAISQKLLPLLEGYGDDYKNFLQVFYENQLSGMEKCQKIVKEIILKGDKNMKHYNFFHR